MNRVPKKDVETVINALTEYYHHIIATQSFNLQEFMNFMEPKFAEAGYRENPTTNLNGRQANILIILDAYGVGDFIWKTGIIREIRKIYPTASIRLVVHSNAAVMAEVCPYVDEVILNPARVGMSSFLEMFDWNIKIALKLLTECTDICFAFTYYLHTPLLMYMCGARERISYHYDEDENFFPDTTVLPELVPCPIKRKHLNELATVSVPQFLHGDIAHNVDISFSLLDFVTKTPVSNREMEIWYTPLDMNVAKNVLYNRLEKTYALAMGGNHKKFYPPEKYAAVLAMILNEEPNTTFVLVGGPKEKKFAEIVKQVLGEKICSKNIIDLTGKITYRQTAAVLTMCDMYIGNDTGTMHIAAAAKLPCLAVFAFPADAVSRRIDATKVSYPYNVPSVVVQPEHALPGCDTNIYNHHGCKANTPHCITQIKPQTVFRGFKLLKKRIEQKINEPLYIY